MAISHSPTFSQGAGWGEENPEKRSILMLDPFEMSGGRIPAFRLFKFFSLRYPFWTQ
jgi:hypothetical protein